MLAHSNVRDVEYIIDSCCAVGRYIAEPSCGFLAAVDVDHDSRAPELLAGEGAGFTIFESVLGNSFGGFSVCFNSSVDDDVSAHF